MTSVSCVTGGGGGDGGWTGGGRIQIGAGVHGQPSKLPVRAAISLEFMAPMQPLRVRYILVSGHDWTGP